LGHRGTSASLQRIFNICARRGLALSDIEKSES
jgi:hypothetical protein